MIRAVYSNNFRAVMRRMKSLPKKYNDSMQVSTKTAAAHFIDEFQNGLKRNNLGLQPLKESTITAKQRAGFPQPRTPLVGKDDDKAYNKMLRRYKTARGYVVRPKPGMHRSGLTFAQILDVHEKGRTIQQNRGGKTVLIRIPPRPGLRLAYERYLKKIRVGEVSKAIKKNISGFLKTGKWTDMLGRRDEYDG